MAGQHAEVTSEFIDEQRKIRMAAPFPDAGAIGATCCRLVHRL